MTMPVNDELREVAAKLWDMAVRTNPLLPALVEALGTPGCAAAVMHLADLIEPEERTCHMVDNGVELCCSECDGSRSYDDEPDYCMHCGARVEEDE